MVVAASTPIGHVHVRVKYSFRIDHMRVLNDPLLAPAEKCITPWVPGGVRAEFHPSLNALSNDFSALVTYSFPLSITYST